MAHETLGYQDRITRDPRVRAGRPVVKGTRVSVELVLEHLAANPDLDDLFGAFPTLTREDVGAVMAYALERVRAEKDTATFVSPREFYREATEREDVRRILAELAK